MKSQLISKLKEPCKKETRRQPFNIEEAKSASEAYIRMLYSYTEAPAEGIFSIYDMILT